MIASSPTIQWRLPTLARSVGCSPFHLVREFRAATGQTIGKRMLGIRVYDFGGSGGPIGYGRAFIRWLGRIISGIPCYLGYLWMLWDKEKQTWHDKLATTVVVPESAYPVER